jgi:hypothetical protein
MIAPFHDDCRILEAAVLYRCGFLKPGTRAWKWDQLDGLRGPVEIVTEADVVRLENQRLPFEWEPCRPTRGADPLWRCPTCGRRCRKLYSPPGGLFLCVEYWEVKYRVWNEGRLMRRLRYAARIGVSLAGAPVGAEVPLSYRERRRTPENLTRRNRIRKAAEALLFELVRDDDELNP